MKAIAIIPARMGSSRFPGKPMAPIHGIPMIGHCYYRTSMCKELSNTYVATCDREIFDYIESVGGKAVMTANTHERATDRTAEAMLKIEQEEGRRVDVVVMVQGDEPLIYPRMLTESLRCFDVPSIEVANLMSRFPTIDAFKDRNNVKVVVNKMGNAMYFSREPIPSPWRGIEKLPMLMQLGIIAFRRNYLLKFNEMEESTLEQIESVDMNRIIENGDQIRMVLTEMRMLGVDTPDELALVETWMKNDELMLKYQQ